MLTFSPSIIPPITAACGSLRKLKREAHILHHAATLLYILLLLGKESFASPRPANVAIIVPLSGGYAQMGRGVVDAFKLREGNARIGPDQFPLNLILEDDPACTGGRDGLKAFNRIVARQKLDAVVTFCTATAIVLAPKASSMKIPLLQLTSGVGVKGHTVVKLMPVTPRIFHHLGERFARSYKTLAIVSLIASLNQGEEGNVNSLKNGFEAHGGHVVAREEVTESTTDFTPVLLRIKGMKADAVTPLLFTGEHLAQFLKQADAVKLWGDGTKLAGNPFFEFSFSTLQSLYPKITSFEGLESINLLQSQSASFKKDFEKAFNEPPPQFADYAFDAATALTNCGANLFCLRKPFHGASGEVVFNERGERIGGCQGKTLRGGEFKEEQEEVFDPC